MRSLTHGARRLSGLLTENRVAKATLYLALLAAALVAFHWGEVGLERVVYPYEISITEGGLIDTARQIASHEPWYMTLNRLPCNPDFYGPVYPGLWALLYRLAPGAYWPGRALAMLGMAGAALVILLTVRTVTGWWSPGLLAAALFVSLYPTFLWTAMARVDALALALTLAGWALVVYNRRLRWVGTALLLAAVHTKLTMVAAPAAAFFALLLKGERRSAFVWLAAFVGGAGAVVAGLEIWTHGAYLTNTVIAVGSRWQARSVGLYLLGFLVFAPVVCLGAVIALRGALRDKRLRPVAVYLLAASPVLLTLGKLGAWAHYMLEFAAVASLATGLVLGLTHSDASSALPRRGLLIALVALQMASVFRWSLPLRRQQGAALAAAISSAPGEVLSEMMGPVVQAGKTAWVEPFATTQMALTGRWDQRPLVSMINRRRFALVVMSQDELWPPPGRTHYVFWTPEEVAAVWRNYRPVRRIGMYWLLTPRKGPAEGARSALAPTAGRPPAAMTQ